MDGYYLSYIADIYILKLALNYMPEVEIECLGD